MFDWSTMRCGNDYNIPDGHSHAFRDSWGRTQLMITHWDNYRMVGRDLDSLSMSCSPPALLAHQNPDPSMYDYRQWVYSPYTRDGRTIYALSSMEWHGHRITGQCTSANYWKCWYNAITLLVSRDRGKTYTNTTPPNHLVASVPYQYFKDEGPYGTYNPSSIVYNPRDGYYHALIRAEPYLSQKFGVCSMRTRNLADPKSWRFWNGSSYSGAFTNPYQVVPMQRAEPHACAPIANAQIDKMTGSLTWNTHFERWLLIDSTSANGVYGFYYSFSEDLINWTQRRLLWQGPLHYTWACGQEPAMYYPSAIDSDSRDRNFGTTDEEFDLYFTRFNPTGCTLQLDRDLIRRPIKILQGP